ncbi:MAG TPA: CocE/NonD family hydrolase [Gaiellaceae bacterium]|nr:CocE/NonD family hydrolase [Gaiellaceae bacterium]
MGPGRVFLAACAVALACAGSANAAVPQELTVAASDGTPLACGLVLPDGPPPAGGWPGLLLFHGLGQTHATMETLAAAAFAPTGYASLACDARGTGGSGGSFGLDGPRETQDARDLVAWLAARPDVSDTQIGAFGLSLGAGAVLAATAAGVPFKAIVPALGWTSLGVALAPQGVAKSGIVPLIAAAVPAERWDPQLAAAREALLGGTLTAAVTQAAAARSTKAALRGIATPALVLQGRHDFLFDLDQGLAAYKALAGPKKLYVGDLGHAPATSPPAEASYYLGEAVSWFDAYLQGGPAPAAGIELARDPWDGTTRTWAALPKTYAASVALPGRAILAAGGRVSRSARLTGGPHETWGAGSVAVRYSGAQGWSRLVATVSVAGTKTPVTEGAVRISKPEGVATIRLLNEVVRLPRGKKLTVTLSGSSADLYPGGPAAGATIAIGRVTLKLPLLRAARSG